MSRFRKIRSRFIKLLPAFLALCVVLCATDFRVQAAEPYAYTVTFYAGDKGTLTGAGVQVSSSSGNVQVKPEGDGSRITVTGLAYGDRVGLAAASGGTVTLKDSGKYYVKGIRKSGYDNNTVSAASFEVTGDEDYVVAYGIRGNMAAYTVNFQDASGNRLAESQTYYGNVGDKPVVAFLYIDGYVPEAYNLTKTLVSDESQNVFTFVYTPVPSAAANPATPGTNQGGTTATGEGTGTEAGNTGDQNAENADDADGQDAGEAGGADAGNEAGDQELQQVPEEDVPRDLVDLDDEETPLANMDLSGNNNITDPVGAVRRNGLIAAVCAAVLLAGGLYIFFMLKRKKRSTRRHVGE